MQKRHVLLLVMTLSLGFNIVFIISQYSGETDAAPWIFPELGPAIIQDSYYGRSPGLESPIGLIGDIPGLYSMYRGNPLQTGFGGFSDIDTSLEIVLLAAAFSLIPIVVVVALGRRSYGSSKTQ